MEPFMSATNQSFPSTDSGSSFAQDALGEIFHVSEVSRGLNCRCVCTDCGIQMIARQGSIRSWHFAHFESVSCGGMTWLHRSAQEILHRERRFTLLNPDYALGELTLARKLQRVCRAESCGGWGGRARAQYVNFCHVSESPPELPGQV